MNKQNSHIVNLHSMSWVKIHPDCYQMATTFPAAGIFQWNFKYSSSSKDDINVPIALSAFRDKYSSTGYK